MYCLCVNVYCHWVTTQMQLINISYHIINKITDTHSEYVILSNIYPTRCNFTQFIYIWKLLYMFRVVPPPIIRSAYNYIYNTWYLSHRYCYLPLSWMRWSCGSNSSTIAADSSNGVTNSRCCRYSLCAPDDGWRYHPKHVE